MRIFSMLFVVFFTLVQPVYAGQVTLTGAQLLRFGAVSAPNSQPFIQENGSLYFDAPQENEVLLVLALNELVEDPANLSFTVNMTRRSLDSEIGFYLSDGVNLLGGIVSDNNGGALIRRDSTVGDDGVSVDISYNATFLVENIGHPAVGEGITSHYQFTATATQTSLTFGANDAEATITADPVLNVNAPLSLIFPADSAFVTADGERYQLNSITFDNAIVDVSEPASLALIAFPLFGLLISRRRKR